MNVLDTDQDGKIDLNEFKSFILRANVNSTGEISSKYGVWGMIDLAQCLAFEF